MSLGSFSIFMAMLKLEVPRKTMLFSLVCISCCCHLYYIPCFELMSNLFMYTSRNRNRIRSCNSNVFELLQCIDLRAETIQRMTIASIPAAPPYLAFLICKLSRYDCNTMFVEKKGKNENPLCAELCLLSLVSCPLASSCMQYYTSYFSTSHVIIIQP